MPTGMQNTAPLVYTLNIDAQLFFQDIHFLIDGQLFPTEKPRTAERCPSNHDSIDTISVESLVGLLQGLDVAIADNRYLDMRIILYLSYQCPISIPVYICERVRP